MECSLYFKIKDFKLFTTLREIKVYVYFMSNCIVGTTLKVFTVKNEKHLPVYMSL